MVQLLLVIFAVILGSAVCSSIETALLSVPMMRVRQLAQSQKPAAIALLSIREKISRPIAGIVILNNVFNIVGSIVVGQVTAANLGDSALGIVSGVLTFLIIIFGEILPKTLGERFAEPISLVVAFPVRTLTTILSPFIWIVEHVTTPISQGRTMPVTNEAEIQFLAKIGRQAGSIEDDEAELIQRVFHLNDVTAADLMTPRVALTALKGDRILAEAKAEIIASPHSRIVIYKESIDEVIGIALKDNLLTALIDNQGEQAIVNLTRRVQFVPESIRADRLLHQFQSTREHLVIVSDEYGGVSGVVTLEDVLEELIDEIVDETDTAVDLQATARRKRAKLLQSSGVASRDDKDHPPSSTAMLLPRDPSQNQFVAPPPMPDVSSSNYYG
ncbi:MAG: hemolysin family protein [Leptolyngbyaceae bacterium]|nr:hemolysin family protein [Leptolyngbyaceae bacterium]